MVIFALLVDFRCSSQANKFISIDEAKQLLMPNKTTYLELISVSAKYWLDPWILFYNKSKDKKKV